MRPLLPLLAHLLLLHPPSSAVAAAASASSCSPSSFENHLPSLPGVRISSVSAEPVKAWNEHATAMALPPLPVAPEPVDFCNVLVEYGHPGLNDSIRVNVWLPLEDKDWNGRFLGQGGGGWAAGNEGSLGAGVLMGMAAANTDAGHSFLGHPAETALSSNSWALASPGNANLNLLQNFAYRALDEMTVLGKAVTRLYFGRDITNSYWHGCSTGGRQGLSLAQRYPTHYQGVLAAAPAINWVTFLVTEYWAHVKMHELNYFPPACELNAITQAAIEACDELDGAKDGLISAPGLCKFDALSVVGKKFSCESDSRKISKEAAAIANAVWTGPIRDGKPVWFGLAHEAALPGLDPLFRGLASTACDAKNRNCKSAPFPISADWIRNWVLQDPDYDLSVITEEVFWRVFDSSAQIYHSLMDSAIPDLHRFKDAGGKIVAWHGLADQLIPPNGTSNYYTRVAAAVPGRITDFFRLFEAPGVAHCFAGPGAFPARALLSLIDWVEQGQAPAFLDAESVPAWSGTPDADSFARKLCPWPKRAVLRKGEDMAKGESWVCEGGEAAVGGHDEL